MFRRALNSIYNPEPIKCTVPKKPLFISVPYLGKDSFLLKRKLTSLIGRFYPQFKIICCFKSSFTIGSMFKFKDRLPHLLMSSRGVSDVGFPIFANTDADADFAF